MQTAFKVSKLCGVVIQIAIFFKNFNYIHIIYYFYTIFKAHLVKNNTNFKYLYCKNIYN